MKSSLLIATLWMVGSGMAASDPPLPMTGHVTLPLADYNTLLDLAGRPVKKPNVPPVPDVLKTARINLEVTGESVLGNIVLDGEVLAPGGRKVPLVNGIIVLDAHRNGTELPLEQENGALSALLPGPGEFAVTLRTGIPLVIETGRASFRLPVPSVGAARLTLSVPGEQTAVNLSPGLITGRSSRDGRTTIDATLVPGHAATIWWAARLAGPLPPVAPKEVRFLSDVKTLISVSDSEVAMAALAEVTVVQGEPSQFVLLAPDGYELTGATGPTLLGSDAQGKSLVLRVGGTAARNHHFLISFSKANTGASADVPLVAFQGAQRETGEVLIESEGAMELNAVEQGGLRRMDLKEASPYLRSLARASLHAAFRYQKKPAEMPALALAWTRFPDSSVLSAVAQRAVVTTLVTGEGRSLTEIKLTLQNQAQPFLKVELPAGATILSAEVAGEKVKPVQGPDGNRVPLLRPGFRPAVPYVVSFVFLHTGVPFARKGGTGLALPRMDLPIGLLEWEVFLPTQLKVADFGGDVLSARLLPSVDTQDEEAAPPGQLCGVVTDATGGPIPRATVRVMHLGSATSQSALTDPDGRWRVPDMPSGRVRVTVSAPGFQSAVRELDYDAGRGFPYNVALPVGSVNETVTVTGSASTVKLAEQQSRQNAASADAPASSNVADLQRRVVGVLPIAVNVPRTGNSYRFVRPLVVDEETRLTFTYRSK